MLLASWGMASEVGRCLKYQYMVLKASAAQKLAGVCDLSKLPDAVHHWGSSGKFVQGSGAELRGVRDRAPVRSHCPL